MPLKLATAIDQETLAINLINNVQYTNYVVMLVLKGMRNLLKIYVLTRLSLSTQDSF